MFIKENEIITVPR